MSTTIDGAPLILALDGPAGAGKSTVARLTALRLGVTVLDTGAMYRAVTVACCRQGVDIADGAACATIGNACDITLLDSGRVLLDGDDITAEIRTPAITAAVSTVSAHAAVRSIMVSHQRKWARQHGTGVVEGRDIGTVVFPDAPLKVFLIATPAERARRRAVDEAAAGREVDVEALRISIEARDLADSQRHASPMKAADDAVLVDTTGRTIDDVVDEIVRRFEDATS